MLLKLNKNLCRGTSLVESLLAILIMTIVALGGAAFIFFSSIRVNLERNKRAALEMANTRLEEMRAAGYSNFEPPAENYSTYFINNQGGVWAISETDPGEIVLINGQNYPIITTVRYWDDDPNDGVSRYDYLLVVVSVGYRLGDPNAMVTFTTYIQSLG